MRYAFNFEGCIQLRYVERVEMKRVSKMFTVGVATLAFASLCGTSASAATVSDDSTGRYCAWVVGPAQNGDVSPVLAKSCSEVSPAAAAAGLTSQGDGHAISAIAEATPLMYWYSNGNYNRNAAGSMTTIYGSAGPCDSAGYRVEPDSYWKANMSSILGDNNCRYAHVTNRALNSAHDFNIDFGAEGAYLGGWDNNVGLTKAHA
ncbi:hypothetical protein [Amycolatopsis sp. NPDC052450]|uniref:hypothetical protein n=1 Tax=Amycolatopsis sp. NPDC052450 TaxID=3363937 RepID=UPI0037CCA024